MVERSPLRSPLINIIKQLMSQSSKKPSLWFESPPDDVVCDILIWLPVKSLMRFRCVSKSWNSTITNPSFIIAHLNQTKSLPNKNDHNGYLLYTRVTTTEDKILATAHWPSFLGQNFLKMPGVLTSLMGYCASLIVIALLIISFINVVDWLFQSKSLTCNIFV